MLRQDHRTLHPHPPLWTHYALNHLWPAVLFLLIYCRQRWTLFSFWGARLTHLLFFSVIFSSLYWDWSHDQRYLSSISPSFPWVKIVLDSHLVARTEWGPWEAMAGKCLKLPAVRSGAKWSSAWWRTSKGSWHHIPLCHLYRLRKKIPIRNHLEFDFGVNTGWYRHFCWVSSEIPGLTLLWTRSLAPQATFSEKPHCNSTA